MQDYIDIVHLNEWANDPYPLRLEKKDLMSILYKFNDTFRVYIKRKPNKTILVEFYNIEDGKANYKKTNSGDQFRIFSTVFKAINMAVKSYDPDKIEFECTNSEPTRLRLYGVIMRKFDTFVSGYHSIGEYDGNGKTVFVAAKNTLNELATDPFQFVQIQKSKDKITYVFNDSENKRYNVYGFYRETTLQFAFGILKDDEYKTDIVKSKSPFRVFSTVVAILKKLIVDFNNPEYVEFSAKLDQPSRIKLYDKFAQELPKHIPEYEKYDNPNFFPYPNYKTYIFKNTRLDELTLIPNYKTRQTEVKTDKLPNLKGFSKFTKTGNHTIYIKYDQYSSATIYAINDTTGLVDMYLDGDVLNHDNGYITLGIMKLSGRKGTTLTAVDFYKALIKAKFILTTDTQSYGGKKVWQKLAKQRNVNIHAYNPETDEHFKVNPNNDDDEDELYADDRSYDNETKNIQLVASKKIRQKA